MIFLLKPIKKIMLEQLRRGRAIELSGTERNICVAEDFEGSLPELCRRGLVSIKMNGLDGKELSTVYITDAGKALLHKYEGETKRSTSSYNIF
jgi:hypothetical protein